MNVIKISNPVLFSFLLFGILSGCQEGLTDADKLSSETTAEHMLLASFGESMNGAKIPFADAEVFFEFNSTDNDLGLQVFLDGEDWEKVKVNGPGGVDVFEITATGNLSELGITELRFESAEPSPGEVLALFPPGTYRFGGKTVEGDMLIGRSRLSHDLPSPPTFTPSDQDDVDPANATVRWSAPGAELVEIIISSEEDESDFDVIVPGSTNSMDIPAQFLQPNTEYKIEILSIAENGNKTITESFFKTK